MRFFIWFCLVCVVPLYAEPTPNQRAEHIAQSSKRVRELVGKIKRRLEQVKPDGTIITAALKKDTLDLLATPHFGVIKRRNEENAITAKLKAALSDPFTLPEESLSLFPAHIPMPFIAAAGGPWNGHHAYPGGLAYHTFTVMQAALDIATRYESAYGPLTISSDLIALATVWHDVGKAYTLTWKDDGSETVSEGTIAGTPAHHIWALAEAAQRGYSIPFLIALASAHAPLVEGQEGFQKVTDFLVAAAILSGTPPTSLGLTEIDGKPALKAQDSLVPNVINLADSDWVISGPAMQRARKALSGQSYWKANEILANRGDLYLWGKGL
jgi:hypothetical protein